MNVAFRFGLPLAAALISLLAPSPAASAQSPTPYLPVLAGTRVRVTTTGGERRIGTLIGASRDSLVVQWDERARDTLARSVAKAEVRSWTRLPLVYGATLGLVGGVAAAGYMETVQNHCDDTPGNYCYLGGKFAGGISKHGYSFGAGGLVVGLLVGATVAERWKPIGSSVTASGVELQPPSEGHGVRVAYAIRY